MKDLHHILVTVNEDEDATVTYILVHQRVNYTAQGVKALSHIYRKRVQIIPQRVMKMEHDVSQEGKQVSEDCQGQRRCLLGVWCRLDNSTQGGNHHSGCGVHSGTRDDSLQSLLKVWY